MQLILLQSSLKRNTMCLVKSESTTCSIDSAQRRLQPHRLSEHPFPYSTLGCTTPRNNGLNNKDSLPPLLKISRKIKVELQTSYCARIALVPRVKLWSTSNAAPVNKSTIVRWIARGIIGARVIKTSVNSFKHQQRRKPNEKRKNLQKW